MVGGFNDDVAYRGRRFHVQTEFSLHGEPRIETLLYEGGAILHASKLPCAAPGEGDASGAEFSSQIETSHRALIQALRSGELDGVLEAGSSGVAADEFGAGVLTESRLDEWLVAHLAAS